jgi:hypothetical protein
VDYHRLFEHLHELRTYAVNTRDANILEAVDRTENSIMQEILGLKFDQKKIDYAKIWTGSVECH